MAPIATNASWLQPLDDFGADCAVDPHAERIPVAMVQMATAAVITAQRHRRSRL